MKLNREKVFLKNRAEDSEVLRLLNVTFRARHLEFQEPQTLYPWNENLFELGNARLWKETSPEMRRHVLHQLCQGVLSETFFIELAGMSYSAKMNLLSETVEEKSYFSLMAAEEASHFEMLKPWFTPEVSSGSPSSFASLIGRIVTEGDRRSNLFLIQILLEGWGLSYYQTLVTQTHDENIKRVFENILKDESRHHAAGVIFFERCKPGPDSFMQEALNEILSMVRVGPFSTAQALLRARGIHSQNAIEDLLHDVNAEKTTQTKLDRLQKLISKSLPSSLLDHCEKKGLFQTLSIQDMAKALLQSGL